MNNGTAGSNNTKARYEIYGHANRSDWQSVDSCDLTDGIATCRKIKIKIVVL
jgi:hypothetical protein